MRMSNILFVFSIIAITLFFPSVYAEVSINKTPNDVYTKVMLLKREVETLRENSDVKEEWPIID